MESAMYVPQLDRARPCLGLHIPGACLLGIDAARARAQRKAAVKSSSVDAARARVKLRILTHSVIADTPEPVAAFR